MADSLEGILRTHTCLYASFDRSPDADVSRGDPAALFQPSLAAIVPNGGRLGGGTGD